MVVTPEGLLYREEFVSPEEERDLLGALEGLDFRELQMRGQTANDRALVDTRDVFLRRPGCERIGRR